jgi:eukaryotic-like serine/threonine-protein kinase
LQPELPSPISFGRYLLIRRIGAGGMGEVFLARDPSGRALVVKKILPHLSENRQFVGRFLDESKVVVRLDHPNIAHVYDMGEVEGSYYLAMEYVQGKTVSRFSHKLRQQDKSLPVGLSLLIGERLCEGLAYAHQAKDEHGQPLHLVHRDLSPANICVSYRGEVKIIDFGAAQSTLKEEHTAPRIVIGNLAYMSPEQAKKQPVDHRADLYSAGAVLWELLASSPLPQKGDPVERWRRAANPNWPKPSSVAKALPKEVDEILGQALQRDPKDRFRDAAELGQALGALRKGRYPGAGEAALGALLTDAFAEEKRLEDEGLAALESKLWAERPTDKTQVFFPPVVRAFEHPAVEEEEAEVSESRYGFGVKLEGTSPGNPEDGEETLTKRFGHGWGLPGWVVYSALFLGASGIGFLGVWFWGR